jgi:hypothetical protein
MELNLIAVKLMKEEALLTYCGRIKRLLHDIFHIGPGISPRLPYQARQRSWRADMGRGLIPVVLILDPYQPSSPGTIWKISWHNHDVTDRSLTLNEVSQ